MTKSNKTLVEKTARTIKTCSKCLKPILPKEIYYNEEPEDKRINFISKKRYHKSCIDEQRNLKEFQLK